MKLQFDANQSFQLDAINAAVDLFKGQPAGASDFAYSKAASVSGTFLSVVANNLILDEESFNQYRPKTFKSLVENFKEYKEMS